MSRDLVDEDDDIMDEHVYMRRKCGKSFKFNKLATKLISSEDLAPTKTMMRRAKTNI